MQEILERLLFLQQFGNLLSRELREEVHELFGLILGDLDRFDPTGVQRRYRAGRRAAFLGSVADRVLGWIPGIDRLVRDRLAVLGRQQAVVAEDSLIATLGTVDMDDRVRHTPITQARIRAILNTEPFEGRVLAGHTEKLGANIVDRVGVQLRLGMAREEPIDDLVRRIRGRRQGRGFTGGVMRTTTREAEALVRTAVTFTANRGMLGTFEENASILAGVRYVATLDDRTCFVAGTPVETPSGPVPIERLRPGDIVTGGSGLARRVEGTRVATSSDLVRVTLSTGQAVECTADHLWLTADQEWVEAGVLQPGEKLAQRLDTQYLTGYEDVRSLRRDIRDSTRQGQQVLRHAVLSDGAAPRRLHRHSRDEGSVRLVREDAHPHEEQEAGRLAGGPPVLLPRVLPRRTHEAPRRAVRRVRHRHEPHHASRGATQVLLARVPHRPQEAQPDQLSGLRGIVHAHPDPARLGIRRLQERSHDMLRRLLQQVGQRGRGAEAEDQRGVSGRTAPELARRPVPPQARLQGAELAPGCRPSAEAGRVPLHRVRSDGRGQRPQAVRAPHRAVPQLRVDPQGESHAQPHHPVQAVPSRSGVEGRGRADASAAPTVVSVEGYRRRTAVYDIQVHRDHSFIVAGAVVHNSLICLSLDGQTWDLDDPEVVIPGEATHFQCRSILVPVVDWAKLGFDGPPPGDRIARDLSGLTEEQFDHAISTRRSRGEFGDVERISSNTLAKEWLRRQPKHVQDEIMGPKRAELFRQGKVSLKQMVTGDLRVVNLDELVGG